ncbi:MAG: potassium channel protein, partial [Candidatus Portnoybacteria bacterium]|nr:potassium channel protein [Candidatus Portnoybacteria bacterium]
LFAAFRGSAEHSLITVIDVVESAKNVARAARHLAKMILEGKELHPVIHEALEETDETIERVTISSRSILANKSLKELELGSEVGISVIGIRRGDEKVYKWIFYPHGSSMLRAGDVVIGVGSNESCEKFIDLASGKRKIM